MALLMFVTLDSTSGGVVALGWRMALIGAAMALFNAPVMTALLAAAPQRPCGVAGGVANLARTLGNAVGPALAALAWSFAGGGETGFYTAVTTMAACTGLALIVTLAATDPRTQSLTHET